MMPGNSPLAPHRRIESLDVLRGLAVLGILVMNVRLFAMPGAAYMNPTAWGDLAGLNFVVWLFAHVLTDQKMMALFSMLFGAGIVLFADRQASKGLSPAFYHYRRNFWLMCFGLAHAYLLWHGDILFLYAVCAFALYPLRNLSPRALVASGVGFLAVSTLMYLFMGWSLPHWPDEALADFMESWSPTDTQLAVQLEAYRGGWTEQMTQRFPAAVEFQTFILAIWGFWRAAGMMLIGMGLYRLGMLSGQAGTRSYASFIAVGGLIGMPLICYGVYWNFANEWGPESLFLGSQFNYWGSILVALAWLSAVMLVLRHGLLEWLTDRLAAVGRMAFSNYIIQSLVCGLVFYGHGLGLFGRVDHAGQLAIVIGIWILQLVVSPLWLRHFCFGPLEWAWRSLTYWQWQPFRR